MKAWALAQQETACIGPRIPKGVRPGTGSHPQKIPLLPGLPRPGCPSDSRYCGLFVCGSRKYLGWSLMRASLAPRRATLEGTITSPSLGVLTLYDKCYVCDFAGDTHIRAFPRLLKFKNPCLSPASSLWPHSGLGRVYRSPCPVPAQWRATSDCQPSAGRAGT